MMVSFAIVSFSGYLLEDVCRGKVQFMGMMRRQWGDIHLWASIALLVLLILHIVLHWSMIDGFFKKSIKDCVGDLVTDFVGMTFGYGFRGKKMSAH